MKLFDFLNDYFKSRKRYDRYIATILKDSLGDSMNWDFMSRRPLPGRDYVVPTEDGP